MIPISGTAPRPAAVSGAQGAERPREVCPAPPEVSAGSRKPARDEYVPEEKREERYGRYWLGKDQDGNPKLYFDDPEAKEAGEPEKDAPEEEEGAAPEKAAPSGGGRKAERCTGSTDAVDREIKKLKEKKEALEKQVSSEKNEARRKELERELSQVEEELRRKDNDAYRRAHSTFTEG